MSKKIVVIVLIAVVVTFSAGYFVGSSSQKKKSSDNMEGAFDQMINMEMNSKGHKVKKNPFIK